MDILTCFKVVRDLEQVIEDDWNVKEGASFAIDYTKKIWNCFDEAALETALRIKDECLAAGKPCRCTALTVPEEGMALDGFYRTLYAVGYDEVVVANGGANVAETIARYAGENGFDAVFLGMQASPEDNGTTGALVAEALGLPFINRVYAIQPTDSGFAVETPVEGGMRRMEIPGRAVYAFGNAKYSYLRAATLREKLNAASKQAREMVVASEKENPALRVAAFHRARPERQVTMLEETLPKKAARMLADTYLSEEMSK